MSALGYEARRVGWAAMVVPPFAVLALGFFALVAQLMGVGSQVDRILSATVQVGPLVGGIAAVSAVALDPALELRLSLPIGLRRSAAARVAVAFVWSALVIGATTTALLITDRFTFAIPGEPVAEQLQWLAPTILLSGIGALVAVAARVGAAGAGTVAMIWVLSNLVPNAWKSAPWLLLVWPALPFDGTDHASWYASRLGLALIGLAAFALTGLMLGRSEYLLSAER